jgi:hypothetical protein
MVGRGVQHLHVRWTYLDASFDLGRLPDSIVALKFNFYKRNDPHFVLSPSLPHVLPHLELISGNIGLDEATVSCAYISQKSLTLTSLLQEYQTIHVLSGFTKLHTLDIFAQYEDGYENRSMKLLNRLHEACPNSSSRDVEASS